MTLIKFAAVAAVATFSLVASHATESAERKEAQSERGAPQQTRSQPAAQELYDSAFADYRPFTGETAPKDWRNANDEVREAGGHVGLMKRAPAQLKGHGEHEAKQPAAPAAGKRK